MRESGMGKFGISSEVENELRQSTQRKLDKDILDELHEKRKIQNVIIFICVTLMFLAAMVDSTGIMQKIALLCGIPIILLLAACMIKSQKQLKNGEKFYVIKACCTHAYSDNIKRYDNFTFAYYDFLNGCINSKTLPGSPEIRSANVREYDYVDVLVKVNWMGKTKLVKVL